MKNKSKPISVPEHPDEWKWKAESDLRTILEAQRIQKDAKRMANVRKIAKEQAAALKAVG